jgi:hypothetical protein
VQGPPYMAASASLPPPGRYCTGAATTVPVCVSQDAVVYTSVSQAGVGQDQGTELSVIMDGQRGHSVGYIAF